jgi:hypothetical protein
MSLLSGSGALDPVNFLAVAVGALAGASLQFALHRVLGLAAGSRRSWIVETLTAFGLGLLAGVFFVAGSGPSSSLGLGALGGLAAYSGTAFAVTWMGQEEVEHAPVVPAAHLLVTLFASLAGAAAVLAVAGKF